MGLLEGKVAIITGAGGAIGRATAELFSREGAKLVVNDLGTEPDGTGTDRSVAERLAAELGAQARAHVVPSPHDVASPAGAAAVVGLAIERFGRLDVLVCATGAAVDRSLLDLDWASWKRVLDVHLDATFLCIQQAARRMVERGAGGRIVTVTGLAGLQGAFGRANTVTALAGMYGLTRAAAVELQKHGITVNAIAPAVASRLSPAEPEPATLPELAAEHAAPAALFLASDLCADVSGEVIAVAGPRLSRVKLVESKSTFSESEAPWTAQQIAACWESLSRL
jgi:NAD(P)-dependent dehydrogenase (short-subunit alcohol dehydrogenase family)